jgi:hypothetical protein
MSSPLEVRAEILKLARLLRRSPEELSYLELVPATDVRELREQVTDVLFSAHGPALARLAAASKVLPIRVVATIGERAFGPMLAARIAGLLDPARAVEMADTMPIEFLADVAVELDPRRASDVISRISPERIAAITRELLRRDEYVTMGHFVGHLGDEAVRAAFGVLDDKSLLLVAFVLESKDSLNHLVSLLPEARRDALVDVAADQQMWLEALDLLSHLSEENRSRFAESGSLEREGVLEAIVDAAVENGLWGELMPLVPELPTQAQQRVVDEVARLDPAKREEITAYVRAEGTPEQVAMLEQALRAA